MQLLNETVGVRVDFVAGKIRPIQFVWRSRQYIVKQVPLIFARQDGGRNYLCFSVDTGGMTAQLAWDRQSLVWKITNLAASYT